MRHTTKRLNELFQKYLETEISEKEVTEFSGYLEDPAFTAEIKDMLGTAFRENSELLSVGDERRFRVLQNILGLKKWNTAPKTLKLWQRILAAAVITIAILGTGLFYYNMNNDQKLSEKVSLQNDLPPGKLGATLTLANGKKIRLTDAVIGELAKEAGVVITKSANGQLVYEIKNAEAKPNKINVLSTAPGETYQVRLPDGSLVWLNAVSSLTYSANLNESGKRRVRLDGEGYFEITKDKTHPFVVETKGQEVEVLGTHFNVNAYSNEPQQMTTLLEGSVRVSPFRPQGESLLEGERKGKLDLSAFGGEPSLRAQRNQNPINTSSYMPARQRGSADNGIILKPNQRAELSAAGIKIKDVDAEDAIAWKEGYFTYNGETLSEIMKQVARWYDVEVIFEDAGLKEKTFIGSIGRFERISKVLNMLSRTEAATFTIEGKTIKIKRKNKPD